MVTQINSSSFYSLLDYGIRNLSVYRDQINALNVFPVPDGDTGTNMLLTLKNGISTLNRETASLSDMAHSFAKSVVFGARGNSGVIVSQFFKGVSESFYGKEQIEYTMLTDGFENGVRSAYKAVSNPVEGTMLTVLREATESVRRAVEGGSISTVNGVIEEFLSAARTSLSKTPELLEVLKSAGVVDSGGAGIVYVFEGFDKFLKNQPLPEVDSADAPATATDFSRFNRDSSFDYGYCTELLIQLTSTGAEFSDEDFNKTVNSLGNSVVISREDDKVKLHVHTFNPEQVLAFCHKFGEFLSLKIENMSVQGRQNEKITVSDSMDGELSIIAVAHDPLMKDYFMEMGADVVILGTYKDPPAAADFVEALKLTGSKKILIFPNNKNTELVASQAAAIAGNKNVYILSTRSDADCYAVLPMIDFGNSDISSLISDINESIDNVYSVLITRAQKNTVYQDKVVNNNDFVAVNGSRLLAVGSDLSDVTAQVISCVFEEKEPQVVTAFVNNSVSDAERDAFVKFVSEASIYAEAAVVDTEEDFYDMMLSFE